MKSKKTYAVILTVAIVISLITTVSAENFSDVPENHPYKDAINFCKAKGFVSGTSSTTFTPDAKLTRGQLSLIWCRSLNLNADNHSFTDITKMKNYYDSSAIILRSLGIISGTSDTKFSPLGFVTREQLAVITMHTYNLGVADQDAYKAYADHAAISTWARDGISACINAKVFEGLFDEENFKPSQPVTRAELCELVYNVSVPAHNVTIGTLEGGSITANPTKARAGTLITLTITPDAGKQLKTGTLKYNETDITGTTFTMPAEDVTITAVFEDKAAAALESITVTAPPSKTTYTAGESLDLSGLIVTAHYSDGTNKAVTGYTTTPDSGTALTVETTSVSVSYTEGDVTKTATFDIVVNAA